MLAIPSPDVLLNLFASAAQVFGLLVLAVGGGWLSRRRLGLEGEAARPASRWPLFAALGLLLCTGAAFLLYHLDVCDANNQRLRTNLVRKSQEAGKAVGDTSLKTLSYSQQVEHPHGVSTEQLQQWIEGQRPLNLIDVREPEEVEMGAIAGTWARRYPDLQHDESGLLVDGKTTVLLCESGNRSSELCDWFTRKYEGVHFLVGGYEKWIAEERPVQGRRGDDSDIRATPDYPQKLTLLDTPEVMRLFGEQQALFVDVRYPEDFARGHLPGAVNLPLRKLLLADMQASIAALPLRPIIAVCYDKRSSFYSLLLGLRLHRLGRDFRGRYTVPHEFALPGAESEWVARWRQEQQGRTLLAGPRDVLAAGLGTVAGRTGMVAAIVLLLLALRALLLPFTLLAERDQWAQRRLEGRLAELRARCAGDGVLLRRAQLQLLRQAGVSPLRNLLGSVLQLVVLALAFAAVDRAVRDAGGAVGWFTLQGPDPLGILPLAFGGALWAFVRLQQRRRERWLLPLLFAAAMVALVWQCRAGVQIYLLASVGAMLLQTLLHRAWLARRERPAAATPPQRLIDLAAAGAQPALGNKAVRLGQLLAAGLPVPPGFVVPAGLQPSPAQLARACRRHRIAAAAVRSSAEGEDGVASSMAGMFRTDLDVPVPGLGLAIAAVRASYGSRSGGVVVQEFRRARYAGVLFTADPAHGGRMLVELVAGGGDALVSGRATPQSFRFGRATGARVGEQAPPLDLEPLLQLGRAAERLFGRPQDIEWVHCDGRFQLVQSRDITRTAADRAGAEGMVEAERQRLLALLAGAPADAEVLAQTELSELLPAPTAYSLALAESLWAAGGSVDRACRALGVPYAVGIDQAPLLVTAFGRCFVDQRERTRRSQKTLGALASFRLASGADALERDWRQELPALQRRVLQLDALDCDRLPEAELLRLCEETRARFVQRTYARAETINVAAEFFVGAARRQAQKRSADAAALLRDGGNVVSAAFAGLGSASPLEQRVAGFVADFGHRAPHDFELSEPRWREDVDGVRALARVPHRRRETAAPAAVDGVLGLTVARARRFQQLKEAAKHEAMRELAALRRLLLAFGGRCGLGDGIFELTPQEVAQLLQPEFRAAAPALAAARRQQRQVLLAVDVPTVLTAAAIERLGDRVGARQPAVARGALRGEYVAGSREVIGRVRVLHDAAALPQLQKGEILVTRCTDPCWLPAFGLAGGLVTEVGGWLSHAAIQAREGDLPAVVGAAQATARLRDGDLVRLCRDGSVEPVAERRRQPRREADLAARLHCGDSVLPVRICELSDRGARLQVPTSALPNGGSFELRFGGQVVDASLAWANCTVAGVAFAAPLPQQLPAPLARTG